MLTAFLLFLLCSAFLSIEGCPPHELKALLRFRSSLNDTQGRLDSWKGADCCQWDGVECSGTQEGRHVSKLDLVDCLLWSVRGEIDASLFQLTHLTSLDLSGNYFHGEIPSQLGNLSSLRHLMLSADYSCSYYITSHYLSCDTDNSLIGSNLQWLSNLSSLEYLALGGVDVRDKRWGSRIGSLLHLQELSLFRCNLPCPSTGMGKLSSLTYLYLELNNICGPIPDSIGKLTRLTSLRISYNALTGPIPDSIGNMTRLTSLDLSSNALTGPIPVSLGSLTNLTYLSLGSNQLTGNIPANLDNLHKLRSLLLYNNQLSGSLLLSVSRLTSLTDLSVSDNRLNGSIPSTLMLPSSLQFLDMSNNNMNGTITEVFFQKSFKLEDVDLSDSGLSINTSSTWIPPFQLNTLRLRKCPIGGPIPSWISTQFRLDTLDLSSTQLRGDLPSWLWDIEEVHLYDNHLQGCFPPTSGSLTNYLNLSMNELNGGLPADIHGRLPYAVMLLLADNKFEGHIPTSIANLRRLRFLDISNNRLTGNVPAALGNLTLLQVLNLDNNSLEGEIPKELGSLSSLQSLRIGKNNLQGILPSSFTNFSELQVLDVGGNNLIGNIPHWISDFSSLHVLVMRSNNFTGTLPSEIGGMPKLQVVDLSSNCFSGAIPHSYLRLPAMQNSSAEEGLLEISSSAFSYSDSIDLIVKGQEMHYEYVLLSLTCFDLSHNRLSGPLPPEVENLKGLMYLNLSGNSLSELIPESLGKLVQLESVDLSFNNFSGRIPSELGQLTFLAHLNLSYNNLFGRIPEGGGQMLTFDASSYIGNPKLWGCPLQRNCSRAVAGASPPPAVGVKEKREKGFKFPWFWMCFGLAVGVGFSAVVVVIAIKLSWTKTYFQWMDRVMCGLPERRLVRPKILECIIMEFSLYFRLSFFIRVPLLEILYVGY